MDKQQNDSSPSPESRLKLISFSELCEKCGGKSRQWVYNQLRADPSFPRPVKTGSFAVNFFEHELDAWLRALPRVEFDGLSAIERRKVA